MSGLSVNEIKREAKDELVHKLRVLSDELQDKWFISESEKLRDIATRIERGKS